MTTEMDDAYFEVTAKEDTPPVMVTLADDVFIRFIHRLPGWHTVEIYKPNPDKPGKYILVTTFPRKQFEDIFKVTPPIKVTHGYVDVFPNQEPKLQ